MMDAKQIKHLALLIKENVIPKVIFEMNRHGLNFLESNGTKTSLATFANLRDGTNTYLEAISGSNNKWSNFVMWSNNVMAEVKRLSNMPTALEAAIESASKIHMSITRKVIFEKRE